MDIMKTDTGFSLLSGGVTFDFKSDVTIYEDRGLYKSEVRGNIPTPEILKGDRIYLPIDEGVVIEADHDYEKAEFNLDDISTTFCGRDGTLCMIVVERKHKFLLISLTDGTNSSYRLKKEEGLYRLTMEAGEVTTVVYGIFDKLISACKAYRKIKDMRRVTLDEKIAENPEIKNLSEGAIFWVWSDRAAEVMQSETNTDVSPKVGEDLLKVADELHKNDVENAMFGLFFDDDSYLTESLYKDYGYIATQYDNYNDILNPELLDFVPNNRVRNCDYVRRRMKDYPDGARKTKDGELVNAWALKGFDGKYYAQKSTCPVVAAKRMEDEVSEILRKYPYYKGRFIDVYGCSLADCFDEKHPVTRTECVDVKNHAYESLKDMGLIVGTEDGFEDIMNNLAYTEGLHTPVCFRYKDSGRRYMFIQEQEEAEFLNKQMLNPRFRVPLWQMVNHECVMAFPYWGISTGATPGALKKRILFACLYGCPPLYSFTVGNFEKVKEDVLTSYRAITEVCKKVATLPMTDFEVVTDDYLVQRSVFGDKYEIVANFSEKVYYHGEKEVKPLDFIIEEK